MEKKYRFHIFIAGMAPDTQTLIVDLKDELNLSLGEETYELNVVDVLEKPQLAEEDRILVTPTILRKSPCPTKKLILNINHPSGSILGLELITNN